MNDVERFQSLLDHNLRHYDVKDCIIKVTELFTGKANELQIEFTLKLCPKVFVKLPYQSLEKILYGLVSNAISSSPKGGHITIHLTKKNENCLITIQDTGEGLSELHQHEMLDRYTLLENDDSNTIPKIGLAPIKDLCDYGGGTINIASKLGEGTSVFIEFPIAKLSDGECIAAKELNVFNMPEIGLEEAYSKNQLGKENLSNKKQILIADSSIHIREYLTQQLSNDFHCFRASSGREALGLANELTLDLIIADIDIRGMSGLELAKILRTQKATQDIPIILTTSISNNQIMLKALQIGVDDFLQKPICPEVLKYKINQRIQAKMYYLASVDSNTENVQISTDSVRDFPLPEFNNERDQRLILNLLVHTAQGYSDESFNKEEASVKAGFSEKQINRKLNQYYGLNFTTFLRNFRLEQARKRLKDDVEVSDVSFSVGFSSPSYFGARFKEAYGITPSQYMNEKNKTKYARSLIKCLSKGDAEKAGEPN